MAVSACVWMQCACGYLASGCVAVDVVSTPALWPSYIAPAAVKDGSESDVDCGSDVCSPCPDGDACVVDSDCESGSGCLSGVCSSTAQLLRSSVTAVSALTSSGLQTTACAPVANVIVAVVVTVYPLSGPGGGSTTVTVSGQGFIAQGSASYRLALSPSSPSTTSSSTTSVDYTTCAVVSDSSLQCGVAPGSASQSWLSVEYMLSGGSWQSSSYVGTSPLAYSYTYNVDQPVAIVLARYPVVAVAGYAFPAITLRLLDGSGGLASGDSTTVITITLVIPGEADNATSTSSTTRRLAGRGLSSSSTTTCSSTNTFTATAVHGIVVFENVSVDVSLAGAGFSLTFATADGAVSTTTPPFNVYQPAAQGSGNATTCWVLDAQGSCCHSGMVDECGVCDGSGSTCAVTLSVSAYLPANLLDQGGIVTSAGVQLVRSGVCAAVAVPCSRIAVTVTVTGDVKLGEAPVLVTVTVLPAGGSTSSGSGSGTGGSSGTTTTTGGTNGTAGNETTQSIAASLVTAFVDASSPLYDGPSILVRDPMSFPTLVPVGVCGNGVCEAGEAGANCSDCSPVTAPANSNGKLDAPVVTNSSCDGTRGGC